MAAVTVPVWVPLVSSAIGGAMAVAGGIVTQLLIAYKEKRTHARKLASERAYTGSLLLVTLLDFRDRCRDYAERPVLADGLIPSPPTLLQFGDTDGDWSVISGALLLRIRRLPSLQQKFNKQIEDTFEEYGDGAEYLTIATDRYSRLEQECTALVNELGELCNLPVPDHLPALSE